MNGDLDLILQGFTNERLITALKEAHEIRGFVKSGAVEDDPLDLHDQLLHNRRQIERLEYLTANLLLLKSRTAAGLAESKAAYEDVYVNAATKPSVGFADFASAEEKDAHYKLAALGQSIEKRKSERTHRDVEAAWDYCRILLRGAEGVQRDLELRIRLISLTTSLEK